MMTYASDGSTAFVEGYPVGAIFCYTYAGTKDGVPYIKNEAGEETAMTSYDVVYGNDKTYLKYMGTTVNSHTFGWVNEFSWKGLSLYVYLEGKFGGKFRSPVPTIPELYNGTKINLSRYITYFTESDYSDHPGLPEPNDYSYYRWQFYNQELSCNVQKASFIRLKELTLSYQLPVAWTRKARINSLKVFAQGRDLGLLWKANNMDVDPEWLPGTNKPYASFTFGLNIEF